MKLMTKKNFTYAFLDTYGDQTNRAYGLYMTYASTSDRANQKMLSILVHAHQQGHVDKILDELEQHKTLNPEAKQDLLERMFESLSKSPPSKAEDAA